MKSIVELVRTNQGFSVVENGVEMNRVLTKNPKQKPSYSIPKKFSQQSFTIYPYLNISEQDNQKYIILPAKSQWFNLNQVHQIQKKTLPQWFKTRKVIFGAVKPDKFEKNEELYRKYRNYIIQLGKKSYVSPTEARKNLAGDVCAIIRIHKFLQGWGLINYVYSKKKIQNETPRQRISHQSKFTMKQRKDCIDKDKSIIERNFDKDHLELLKKITRKLRPFCQFCQGICGVVWYQYQEKIFLKEFRRAENQQKASVESSKNSFIYTLRVCASCFNNGNIPIVLSMDNFVQKHILQNLKYNYEEPKDKKKIIEQNKMLQTIQKNKFNLKKSADILKINEESLYLALLFIPLIKIQKMSRIDQQTDTEDQQIEQQEEDQNLFEEEPAQNIYSLCSTEQLSLNLKKFFQCLNDSDNQELKIYEKFIQIWLSKTITKMGKLNPWQKSIKWLANQEISSQKNKIAEVIKKS